MGVALVAVFLLIPASVPAQTDSDPTSVEDLRAEKRRIQAERIAAAKAIDATNVEIDELNDALSVLRGWINSQELVVATSRQEATSARNGLNEAQAQVDAITDEIDRLGVQIKNEAVRSFLDERGGASLLGSGDPTTAVRQDSLSRYVLGSNDDLRDSLDHAREQLVVGQQALLAASQLADSTRRRAEADLATLQGASEEHAVVLAAAEERLDHLLAERQSLAELDASVSTRLSAAEALLVDLLSGANGLPGSRPVLVGAGDIVHAGFGVMVHVSIAADVTALFEAAHADGINLGGGGYRDSEAQIRLRRKHCGTSDYAIYEMSPSKCRPPTARPGSSMHEQGKAIDFTYNGSIIKRRSGPGWDWLAANAASYGLYNLPTEPWHFSTNGR
ncbi:MAG: hypothetical protein HKN03_03380 [Acidimicrobiales bacterium]|nr:hypothetical protein [Acidimicrobiales bacterium]